MVRPIKCRRVWFLPKFCYFRPENYTEGEVILTIDEFEALRLKDLEGLQQEEVAKKIGVSQPTLHRLLRSARKKVAEAIVNGKAIKIEGGVYVVAGKRGRGFGHGKPGGPSTCICPRCGYEEPHTRGIPCSQVKCPKCGIPMVGKR